MNEEIVNQTEFASQSHPAIPENHLGSPTVAPKKTIPKLLVAAIVGSLALILIIGSAMLYSKRQAPEAVLVFTPSPTQMPAATTAIYSQLEPLYAQIGELNPELNEVTFPPIHFDVRLQEPKTR